MNLSKAMMLMVLLLSSCCAGLFAQAALSPLVTTFAGGNGQAGNMFEVRSLSGIVINDFDVNFDGPVGDFEVWTLNMPGTFLFNQNSNANWTLVATVMNLPSQGNGASTPLGLNLALDLPAGVTQSFYITGINGTSLNYTDGSGFGNVAAANLDLEILEGFGGAYFDLVFVPRIWNGNIHYSDRILTDVSLFRIIAPMNDTLDCSLRSSTETVRVRMQNGGLNPITAGTILALSFTLDGNPPVVEMVSVPTTLSTGATFSHTFAATADLSSLGAHSLVCDVVLAGDMNPSNDSLSRTVGSGGQLRVSSFPYAEDFFLVGSNGGIDLPLGWIQEPGDATGLSADWNMRNDLAQVNGLGPNEDRTFGVSGDGGFAYVRDDGDHAVVAMRSPCFDLSSLTNPNCRFFLHSNNPMSGGFDSLLSVDVISQPSGVVTPDVLGPEGPGGPGWRVRKIDLSAFAGQLIQLVFRVDSTGSLNDLHDVAIDDFSIAEEVVSLGQAPQPGLAVLDLNDCHTGNVDPLQLGLKGPYFANARDGGSLIFKIEGEPAQPILLFVGPLNPAVASFAGIGSIDAGGPIGAGGIPTSLLVLADGASFGGLNAFFVTSATGSVDLGFSVPALPPGVLGTFQCAIPTTVGAGLALSNAVEVTVR